MVNYSCAICRPYRVGASVTGKPPGVAGCGWSLRAAWSTSALIVVSGPTRSCKQMGQAPSAAHSWWNAWPHAKRTTLERVATAPIGSVSGIVHAGQGVSIVSLPPGINHRAQRVEAG